MYKREKTYAQAFKSFTEENFQNGSWLPTWHKFYKWNGQHQLLPTTESPSISASTTSTNLSSWEALPGLHSSGRKMTTLEENLRAIQPEIEPIKIQKVNICSSDGSINNSGTPRRRPILLNQVIAALSISLVSLVVGFMSAFTSPSEESILNELHISEEEMSWVVGLMPLGALIGGLAGGQMIELLGRKCAIVITDILFIISWITIALATNVWYLYVGRSIAGFAVGIGSLVFPVYLGETIQPKIRGTLGLLPTAFGNTGILLCYAAGTYLTFSKLAWVGSVIPLPFLVLAFIIPETPRWYVAKKKEERARHALQWLRGKNACIQEELDTLTKSQREADTQMNPRLSDLFLKKANLKPLLISLGLMFFQQLSGINAVIFYTNKIFEKSGSTIDKNVCSIIVGLVNFVSTFIATTLIDRLGRKVLLYISSISMMSTLGILGTYFYLSSSNYNVEGFGWIPLASFVIYVLGFSLGFGPIPWLMLGEIFPAKVRGSAASVTTAFNWSCTFIVTKTFIDLMTVLGAHGTFWLFAVICVFSLIFVIFCVPETRGQSLYEIERKLAGLKVRRMSSIANMKPLPSNF